MIKYSNELRPSEIGFFRGAVLSKVSGSPHDELFSGHTAEGLRYSYPLIQYKRVGGQAALVCIGEGVESIGDFFSTCDFDMKIGNREMERFEIEKMDAKQYIVQVWDESFRYVVRKWLPLNSKNHKLYNELEGLKARADFLEKVLIGNVLSMCKGLGIKLEREVKCEIIDILDTRKMIYKGVKMDSFDVEFRLNVTLPDYCGIGKGVSLGMGVVKMMKK